MSDHKTKTASNLSRSTQPTSGIFGMVGENRQQRLKPVKVSITIRFFVNPTVKRAAIRIYLPETL